MGERPEDAELLYQAYLGLLVLRTMCRRVGLKAGEKRCAELLEDIGGAHPDFAARSALR